MNPDDIPSWDDIKDTSWPERLQVVGWLLALSIAIIPEMLFLLFVLAVSVAIFTGNGSQ